MGAAELHQGLKMEVIALFVGRFAKRMSVVGVRRRGATTGADGHRPALACQSVSGWSRDNGSDGTQGRSHVYTGPRPDPLLCTRFEVSQWV
jgi:hypothetical protein